MSRKILVAGGGFAGLWAALAAKRNLLGHGDMDVQLISNDPHLTMRPRLYEAEPETLRIPLATTLDVVGVTLTIAEIADINAEEQQLSTSQGTLSYDRLVLATGSHVHPLPVPGGELCLDVDSYAGAVLLNQRLRDLISEQTNSRKILIIGAGFTGIELATELRSRLADMGGTAAQETSISLLDSASDVGSELGANPRAEIEQALRDAEVELMLGSGISHIEPGRVSLDNGQSVEASIVINCTGMRASPLTACLTSSLDSTCRLPVDEHLRVQGTSSIFAAGDTARAATDDQGHHTLMSCQHALATGRYAGHNAARDLLGKPMTPYRQERYITCLDLGASGAVVTEGWDRQVIMTGREANQLKRDINTQWIYPPVGTAEEILAQAALPEAP